MKPAPFEYHRPSSLDEALNHLREHGSDARLLAGGQSLLPLMNRRLIRPAVVVDLVRVPGLSHVTPQGEGLAVGTMATHATLQDSPLTRPDTGFGVIGEAAGLIGHRPVRTMGTIGGSLAHADPAAEWCLVAALLDVDLVLADADGTRVVSVQSFLRGRDAGELSGGNTLRPDEMVLGLRVGRPSPTAELVEFGVQEQALPLVAAAAEITVDSSGLICAARLALGGVANRAIRLPTLERELIGRRPDGSVCEEVGRAAAAAINPPSDLRATAPYRRRLAGVLMARALAGSARRADPDADLPYSVVAAKGSQP